MSVFDKPENKEQILSYINSKVGSKKMAQNFMGKHNLSMDNMQKLAMLLGNGKLKSIDFTTAAVGNLGNSYEKKVLSMLKENKMEQKHPLRETYERMFNPINENWGNWDIKDIRDWSTRYKKELDSIIKARKSDGKYLGYFSNRDNTIGIVFEKAVVYFK